MSIFELAAAAGAAIIHAAEKVIDFFKALNNTSSTKALPPPAPVKPCPLQNDTSEEQDPALHSIEILIQDERGKPIPNVAIVIKLPDGSFEDKSSNNEGMIEIKNLDPGTCQLYSDWKDYTVSNIVFLKQ